MAASIGDRRSASEAADAAQRRTPRPRHRRPTAVSDTQGDAANIATHGYVRSRWRSHWRGRTALVTGASKGIGKAIAAQFAASGANVMISSRKQEQLDGAAPKIVASGAPGDVDTCSPPTPATSTPPRRVWRRPSSGSARSTSSSTTPPPTRTTDATLGIDPSRFDKTFEVNLRGPLYWCHHAWEAAFREHPGVIVNIASVGGLRAEFGLGVYNLTKAALIHLTRQLANELGPTRVVGVAPGLVQTDFASVLVENFGESLAKQLPTKRLGEPSDIANLVTFLASDAASWITGETYVIDGGAGVRGVV